MTLRLLSGSDLKGTDITVHQAGRREREARTDSEGIDSRTRYRFPTALHCTGLPTDVKADHGIECRGKSKIKVRKRVNSKVRSQGRRCLATPGL